MPEQEKRSPQFPRHRWIKREADSELSHLRISFIEGDLCILLQQKARCLGGEERISAHVDLNRVFSMAGTQPNQPLNQALKEVDSGLFH